MLSWEEAVVFQEYLPILASLTLHHKVVRVVRHLALAVPSYTKYKVQHKMNNPTLCHKQITIKMNDQRLQI